MGSSDSTSGNTLQILATLLLAGFTVAALLAGLGVVWVVAAGVPASRAVQAPELLLIRRVAPDLRLGAGRPRKALVRRLFSFSWAIVIMQGAGLLKSRTDELVIAAVLPVARFHRVRRRAPCERGAGDADVSVHRGDHAARRAAGGA